MHFITGLFLTLVLKVISAVSITASDLPACAVECYCITGAKYSIPVTNYEQQCRSAPFQIHLRDCAKKTCSKEEFGFVCPSKIGLIINRLNFMQRNTVLRSKLILIRFLWRTTKRRNRKKLLKK